MPGGAALASLRLDRPRCSAPSRFVLARHAALRLGGCGGFRVAALLRARLASLGAALLGTISFALRAGRRFGGFGGVRAAALLRVIATPHGSAAPRRQ